MKQWVHENVDSTDILAVIVLLVTVFLSYHDIGGDDLPKYILGGIVGYMTKVGVAKS